jgi:hypothetical protein
LLEAAIAAQENTVPATGGARSKWANRRLLPEYEAMLQSGAFGGGTDTSVALSEERDAR